jgi:hypothetical protein
MRDSSMFSNLRLLQWWDSQNFQKCLLATSFPEFYWLVKVNGYRKCINKINHFFTHLALCWAMWAIAITWRPSLWKHWRVPHLGQLQISLKIQWLLNDWLNVLTSAVFQQYSRPSLLYVIIFFKDLLLWNY